MSHPTPVPSLGPLESAIMSVVWDAEQPLTGRTVLERLDYTGGNGKAPAYTTVMTIMTLLWHKGLLARARRPGQQLNRSPWWYHPCLTREQYLASVIQSVLACAPDPAAVLRLASVAGPIPGPGSLPAPARPGPVAAGTSPATGVMAENSEVEPGLRFRLTEPEPAGRIAVGAGAEGQKKSGGPAAAVAPRPGPLPDSAPGLVAPARVLAALRAQLAATGIATGDLLATRLQATLTLTSGPAVTSRGGWLTWCVHSPAHHGELACAVHPASDLAGAIERLARPGPGR